MADYIATFTNPERNLLGPGNGASEPIPITNQGGFITRQNMFSITEGTFYIGSDITTIYENETLSSNACQKNSTVLVQTIGTDVFNGYVRKKPKFKNVNGVKKLVVECYGKDGMLLGTFCKYNGLDIWSRQTTQIPVSEIPLQATTNYGSFDNTLWPDPGDASALKLYLHNSVSNTDDLEVSIGDGSYVITVVNQGTKTFSVDDNVPDEFTTGLRFEVSGSTGNDSPATTDSKYTVASASWSGSKTEIIVNESIPDPTADGNIIQDTIILSSTASGFKPRGWVVIESEFIYHDSYDNADADGDYRLRGCKRGELGSSAVAHVVTTTCYEKLTKQVAPSVIILEQDTGSGYEVIREKNVFRVNHKLAMYELSGNASGSYRVTCDIYDEDKTLGTYNISAVDTAQEIFSVALDITDRLFVGDVFEVLGSTGNDADWIVSSITFMGGSTLITVTGDITDGTVDGAIIITHLLSVTDIVTDLLQISVANQGPAIPDAMLDLSAASGAYINRYDYHPQKRPKYTYDVIQELLAGLEVEEDLAFFYDHKVDKYRLLFLDNTSPVFTVPYAMSMEEEDSLEDVFSGVRVEYSNDQSLNLNTPDFAWHQSATGSGTSPNFWQRMANNSESWQVDGSQLTTSYIAGNFGIDVTNDDNPGSKFGCMFNHDPAGSVEFAQWHFGPDTPLLTLKSLNIKFSAYRAITGPHTNSSNTYQFHFEGCTDYNASSHTGTWKKIGFDVSGKPAANAKWAEAKGSEFIINNINGLRLILDYMPGPKSGGHWFYIHELIINGDKAKYFTVETTNDPSKIYDPAFIYAPLTHQKLRGGVGSSTGVDGIGKYESYPIGVSSDQSAVSMARFIALLKLTKYQEKHYIYIGVMPGIPRLGITINIKESGSDEPVDYTGVLRDFGLAVMGNRTQFDFSVLDYSVRVIT